MTTHSSRYIQHIVLGITRYGLKRARLAARLSPPWLKYHACFSFLRDRCSKRTATKDARKPAFIRHASQVVVRYVNADRSAHKSIVQDASKAVLICYYPLVRMKIRIYVVFRIPRKRDRNPTPDSQLRFSHDDEQQHYELRT